MRPFRLGRVPLRALAFVLLAASVRGGLGCTYDFTVGKNPPSAADGGGGDATLPDVDAGAGAMADATSEHDAAASPCGDLAVKIAEARESAVACDLSAGDFCDEFVIDECGCAVGVVDATDPATRVYLDAINRFEGANCTSVCGTEPCSRSTFPGQYFCQHAAGTTEGACARAF